MGLDWRPFCWKPARFHALLARANQTVQELCMEIVFTVVRAQLFARQLRDAAFMLLLTFAIFTVAGCSVPSTRTLPSRQDIDNPSPQPTYVVLNSKTIVPQSPSKINGIAAKQLDQLPPEAVVTIKLIKQRGPFPYRQDGVVFQNRERFLPIHPEGYYHEYTVKTPGSPDRGARRIITGAGGEFYYTDDHYNSFVRIIVE